MRLQPNVNKLVNCYVVLVYRIPPVTAGISGRFSLNKLIMEPAQNGGSDVIQINDHRSFSEISPSLNKQTIGSCSGMSSEKAQAPKKPKRSFSQYFIKPPRRPGVTILRDSTSATIQIIANERAPVEPLHGLKDGVKVPFVGEIRWAVLKDAGKRWLRNPKNLPVLIWWIGVAVSGAINVLVMVGLLNRTLPKKSQRDAWHEVSNQIVNALFTLMCLYQHPQLCYHLLLLIRWKPEDIVKLIKVYCKNGSHKPHEWAHLMVVVLLLQVTIFAQYAVSGLNWGYKRSERPIIGVNLCFGVSTGAFVAVILYLLLSPLRKDYEAKSDLGAVNPPSQVNSGMLPLNAQATAPTVPLGSADMLPPAVNSASRVNSGMLPLNAQASVPTVSSPVHYSVRNSLPPQGFPFWREGSNFFTTETPLAISPASESEDPDNVVTLIENPKKMNAPIPQSLEKSEQGVLGH